MMQVKPGLIPLRFASVSAAVDEQMRRYQQELDAYFSSPTKPVATTCCSMPKKEPKKPEYVSPFAPWLKSKSLPKRVVGTILDWACWFFESFRRDVRLLLTAKP